jgi:hypothetical protein
VPEEPVLGSLLFIVFVNVLCDALTYSRGIHFFANDIKIYHAIKSPDCNLLQSDINSIQGWCTANCINLSISKTEVTSFSRKTNILIYVYKLSQASITHTNSIVDMAVFLNSKLHFHDHVSYVFSHCIKLLDLVHSVNFTFSSLECMYIHVLYFYVR